MLQLPAGLHCSRLAGLPSTGRPAAAALWPLSLCHHHRPLSFLAICWRQAGSAWKAARSLPNTCADEARKKQRQGWVQRAACPAGRARAWLGGAGEGGRQQRAHGRVFVRPWSHRPVSKQGDGAGAGMKKSGVRAHLLKLCIAQVGLLAGHVDAALGAQGCGGLAGWVDGWVNGRR